MTSAARIIIVDDEPDLRDLLTEYLAAQGFQVRGVGDGVSLRALIGEFPPDLVVLDLNLPGEHGLTIARWLRESSACSIIMLTAAGELVDRVVGLEMGADDYLPKPFDPRELLARVRSVLRRSFRPAAGTADTRKVRFGDCLLDLEARRLYRSDGREVKLTAMEFDLLQAFASHPNRVLSRDQLLELAHHKRWDPFDRSIDIRIARIRRKVEPDPDKPRFLKTVRGAGYLFAPDSGAEP